MSGFRIWPELLALKGEVPTERSWGPFQARPFCDLISWAVLSAEIHKHAEATGCAWSSPWMGIFNAESKIKAKLLNLWFYYLTFKADKSIFFPLKRNKAIREPGNALSPSQDSHPKACIMFFLLLCAILVMWLGDGITGSSVATTQNSRGLSYLPKEENPCVKYINKMTLAWRLKEKFCRDFGSLTVLK